MSSHRDIGHIKSRPLRENGQKGSVRTVVWLSRRIIHSKKSSPSGEVDVHGVLFQSIPGERRDLLVAARYGSNTISSMRRNRSDFSASHSEGRVSTTYLILFRPVNKRLSSSVARGAPPWSGGRCQYRATATSSLYRTRRVGIRPRKRGRNGRTPVPCP